MYIYSIHILFTSFFFPPLLLTNCMIIFLAFALIIKWKAKLIPSHCSSLHAGMTSAFFGVFILVGDKKEQVVVPGGCFSHANPFISAPQLLHLRGTLLGDSRAKQTAFVQKVGDTGSLKGRAGRRVSSWWRGGLLLNIVDLSLARWDFRAFIRLRA